MKFYPLLTGQSALQDPGILVYIDTCVKKNQELHFMFRVGTQIYMYVVYTTARETLTGRHIIINYLTATGRQVKIQPPYFHTYTNTFRETG